MKLYELQIKPRGISSFGRYEYKKDLAAIKRAFVAAKKEFKGVPLTIQQVYKIEVNTKLSMEEWMRLLETDAPGLSPCTLTPQDLITKRELIKETIRE